MKALPILFFINYSSSLYFFAVPFRRTYSGDSYPGRTNNFQWNLQTPSFQRVFNNRQVFLFRNHYRAVVLKIKCGIKLWFDNKFAFFIDITPFSTLAIHLYFQRQYPVVEGMAGIVHRTVFSLKADLAQNGSSGIDDQHITVFVVALFSVDLENCYTVRIGKWFA